MRIKSLNVSGFKSFCDQTRVLFDSSLTAVVGPNGCGKSNIVDAIRWGLGEQSAKNLRGRGMEDVIFNGSEKRGPQSMAEVTITFDNTDGLSHPLYVDYPEIAVTRRLHRDGTSEYLINKTPCRLKDITDLFLGTGGGARAYSIIEQGRIGLIVSSRSEDRRAMFEEAAGITRFKKARATALRKMEQTQQNLLRITDVVREMDRNLGNLRKQARKAERYKLHAAEQLDQELYLGSHRYLEFLAAQKTIDACLGSATEASQDERFAVETLEAQVESLRVEETQSRSALDIAKSRAFEADSAVSMLETEIRHLSETLERIKREESEMNEGETEAQVKLATLGEERKVIALRLGALSDDAEGTTARREEAERLADDARARLEDIGRDYDARRDQLSRARANAAAAQSDYDNLQHRIDDADGRLEIARSERRTLEEKNLGLEKMLEDLEAAFETAQTRLEVLRRTAKEEGEAFESLRQELSGCDEERQRVRDSLHRQDARLRSLLEMSEGLERHDNSVKDAIRALNSTSHQAFMGLLVDFIECPEKFEVALAAALADRLQALVTEDMDAGLSVLGWLKDRDIGRVTALAARNPVSVPRIAAISDEGIVGRLVDLLTVDPRVSETAEALLGNVFVVESTVAARRLFDVTAGSASFVTIDGQYIDQLGIMRGGRAGSAGADLLGQKRQIRELEHEVSSLKERHVSLEERFEYLKDEMQRRGDAAETARRESQQSEFQLNEVSKDRVRAREDMDSVRDRREYLAQDIARQEENLATTRQNRDAAGVRMEQARAEISSVEQTIMEQSALIEAYREEADRLTAAVTDAKVRQAQFQHQYQSAVERSQKIAQDEEEIADRLSRLAKRRVELARESGNAAGRIVADREQLAGKIEAIDLLSREVEQLAHGLDEHVARRSEAERILKDRRGHVDEKDHMVAELRIARQKAASDITHLLESFAEKHNINLLRVLGDYHWRRIPGDEVFARITELKGLIERMGPINPNAIRECNELQERFDRMSAQKADVEQALADLETAIGLMDKDSRRLFKESFDVINEKFQEIFPRLFKGGQARLQLTDPDNLLETGVDIIASPPGKKLGNIELMSGGEKALTAVSLLFAIFLHRPSPFCLLDEVDAPLDEANVGRFVEMVQEMTSRSQFIVITHSKVTMEGADALYGVTMQEPGVSKLISVKLVHREAGATPADNSARTA